MALRAIPGGHRRAPRRPVSPDIVRLLGETLDLTIHRGTALRPHWRTGPHLDPSTGTPPPMDDVTRSGSGTGTGQRTSKGERRQRQRQW